MTSGFRGNGSRDPRPAWGTRQRGFALLISMGILGLLAILGTTFVMLSRVEVDTASSYVDRVRARMVAFSGLEAALGALNGYDRQQPWSGHYWNGVYPTTSVGRNGLSAIGDGGSDDWYYGELFKTIGAAYTATERPYGQAIPRLGRSLTITGAPGYTVPPATAVAFQKGVATSDTGVTMGYSSDPNVFRGTYVNRPDNPGDFYILKIVDSASRIYVNDSNRPDASGGSGRLADMLNTLGGELVPSIPGLGTTIMAARGANNAKFLPNTPFKDEADFRARMAASLTTSQLDQLKDFITFYAWTDPNVVRVPFISATPISDPNDFRAPVNINTATKEVLVAVLNGVSATFPQRVPTNNAPAMVTVTLSLTEARALADHIIACRYFYGGNPAVPIAYPHVDWMHVFEDTFDTFTGYSNTGSGGPPGFSYILAKKDLCKAAFCPNTTIKKWNPDIILVDPDITGRTDFTLLDKSDLKNVTTEFCFGSMGFYDIEVVGMIWDIRGRTMATHTIQSTVKTHDVLRLSTQEQFEMHREFPSTAREPMGTAPYNPGSRQVSITTLPEYPFDRNYPAVVGTNPWPGSAVRPAKYDGQLILNSWVNHRATPTSFLAGFNGNTYNAFRGSSNLNNQDSMMPVTSMLPATVTTWTNFYNTQLHPFGVYFDKQFLPSRRLRFDEQNLPRGNEGTVECWFKPAIDLLGAGFDGQTFNIMGDPCRVNEHYVLCRMRNRQIQVVLAKPTNSFSTFIFVPFPPFVIIVPPSPSATVTLTAPITNGTGPKEWLPHTWHHIEFNWSEAQGKAQLYLDGDLMDEEVLDPASFFPFDPGVPPTDPFVPGGGLCGFLVGNAMTPTGAHDPEFHATNGLIGTIDNVCAIDKVLHTTSFPSRSRYHDISFPDYTFGQEVDTSGNHGQYRRVLQEVMDSVTLRGPATMLTLSCTHYHPPHEHSTGDHGGGTVGMTGIALGHVTLSLERAATKYNFYYDNCAGTATIDPATGKGIQVAGGVPIRLLVKMELAENSQIPHNVGPIVDDITVTYTHGPKMLYLMQGID